MSGENVTVQPLTEVLNHVITLGLSVNQDIEAKGLLLPDDELNLLLNELLVLFSSDLFLGEFLAGKTDLLGLWEGSDSGGGEERKVEVSLLGRDTSRELRIAVVHLGGDLGLPLLDSGVVGSTGCSTSLNRRSVGLELGFNSFRAGCGSLSDDGNLLGLLDGKREPICYLNRQALLGCEGVRGVEKGRRSSNNNTLGTQRLDGFLDNLDCLLKVGFPDITSIDYTSRECLAGCKSLDNLLKLLRSTDKVNVDTWNSLGKNSQVVNDVSEIGCKGKLGDLAAQGSELLVGRTESLLSLLRKVKNKDGLINLDSLGTSLGQLGQELLVDR